MRLKPLTLLIAAASSALFTGCSQLPTVSETNKIDEPQLPVAISLSELVPTLKTSTPLSDEALRSQPEVEATIEANTLLDRVRAGMVLVGTQQNPRIDKQEKWYGSHPAYFDRVLKRAERYLFHIVNEVEARDMPMELALLPAVESAFDPFAYSHSHAAGLWQFIPGTAKRFGLQRDWWQDGRRDVTESTRAALEYLEYLNGLFDGDWLLALAAYNSGEGTVRRAIKRNQRAGKATDFWSLKLPRETRAYVPQLLAVSRIIANPEQHQLSLLEIANEPYFGVATFDAQIDLEQAALLAAIDSEELYRLNPAFNRLSTAPGKNQQLLLPVNAVERFQQALEATPKEQWMAAREYRVKAGDYLGRIAKKHKVTVADLRQENNLRSDRLSIGQVLRIPGAGVTPMQTRQSYYTVVSGDSLWKIARNNKVSVKQLRAWNNLAPSEHLKPGQQLQVSSYKPILRTANRKLNYRVKRGDSLARIASHFNVRVKDILSWNSLNPKKYLQPGQKLTLFVDIRKI
ncbi:LysM peptidoglycan-binding domain-containing protein [bacterium SCSIO 12696]|nr:LysM peptidoglycan-binding domain-containing protein [bacterium SCSIO 12696]